MGAVLLLATVAGAAEPGVATNCPFAKLPWPSRPPTNETDRVALEQGLDQAWRAMPLPAKLRFMRTSTALRTMPEEDRRFVEERIDKFLTMSEEEHAQLKKNQHRWKQMSPAERQQAREAYEKRRGELDKKPGKKQPDKLRPPAAEQSTNVPTNQPTEGTP